MATTKVSALAETTTPQSNDELLINQSGVSKKVKITNLPAGTPGTGSISTAMIADDAVTTDKLANAINSAITANTAKTSNVTHTGDVTGATALTIASGAVETGMIADDAVTAAKLANSINTDIATGVTGNTTANAALPKAGGNMTGSVNFTDNSQIRLGSSNDLSIYHDGSDSIINEEGTGTLIVMSNGNGINLQKGTSETMAQFVVDGAVNLYHNNVKKLETTAAGATVTGALAVTGTVDGVDIQTLNTTANAALPKAGGTMTGNTLHGDNVKDTYGTGADLEIYHNGSNSFISDVGTGNLKLVGTNIDVEDAAGYNMVTMTADGAVDIYYNHAKKFETTANGVTVTGGAVGTMTTDNDGSFAMSASNNFKCTPAGNFALTFTAIVAQSGNILFINSGGHTISAHTNTKVDANLLATISTAGTYLLSYFSDGTNVYMTNSAVYA